MTDMKEELKKVLAERKKSTITDCGLKQSAVLIPIFKKNGKCHMLFTKRTEFLKNHRGQISFPGGAQHEEDKSLLATALRESYEEIGLKQSDVEVLGELDDVSTVVSLYCITPFVGMIPYPYNFQPSSEEVEEIFDLPLENLMCSTRKEETQVFGGSKLEVVTYQVNGRVIWGATARILSQFLDIMHKFSGAHCDR